MFKFKSRFEIAQDITDAYDDEELMTRFNDYCDKNKDPDNLIFYNGDEFLSMFSKTEIADTVSYNYYSNDTYVRLTPCGFESANYIRDLLDDDCIRDMNRNLLRDDDEELQKAYDDYLESLAYDNDISIQDWVENIVLYHDSDDDKKYYGIDSSEMIEYLFTLNFSKIYNHSLGKQIQYAKAIMKDRTDIFSDFTEIDL